MSDEHNERLDRSLASDSWTVNTLHDHITEILAQMERRLDDRFEAQETATKTALDSAKEAVNAAMAAAEKAVLKAEQLATTRAAQQNEWRETVGDLVGTALTRVEYAASHEVLVERIGRTESRLDKSEGTNSGSSKTVGYLFAGIGGIAGLIGIVVALLAMFAK